MPEQRNFIHQLQNLLSPNYTGHFRLREDLIFDFPPLGFFRIAHARNAQNRRARILCFARHPGDFFLSADAENPLKGNEHIYPVCIEEIMYDPATPPLSSDKRERHDITWALAEIYRLIQVLPAVMLQESTLHRLNEDVYVSGYIGYRVVQDAETKDLFRITVSTNTTHNFQPVALSLPPKLEAKKGIAHAFRAFGRQLLRRLPSNSFALGLRYQNGHTEVRKTFVKDEVIPAIKSDFVYRMAQIWEGKDPVEWRENRSMPVVRLEEKLRKRVNDMREAFRDDKRTTLTQLSGTAIHLVLDGIFSTLGSLIVDTLVEANLHEKPSRVPRQWSDAIRDDIHMLSVSAYLNRLLLKIDPKKFFASDYFPQAEWLHHDRHRTNVPVSPACGSPAIDSGFSTWLQGQFFIPYSEVTEYIGEGGFNIGPQDTGKIAVMRCNVPNGLQMFYLPTTRVLYAYYHPIKLNILSEDGLMPQQHLAPGSEKWFRADTVLKLDMTQGIAADVTPTSFDAFAADIHASLGGKNGERVMTLLRAHQYDAEKNPFRPQPAAAAEHSPVL